MGCGQSSSQAQVQPSSTRENSGNSNGTNRSISSSNFSKEKDMTCCGCRVGAMPRGGVLHRLGPDTADNVSQQFTLIHAAKSGETPEVDRLTKQDYHRIHEKCEKSGLTPLIMAAKEGHESIVQLLLKVTLSPGGIPWNAELNAQIVNAQTVNGISALMMSARYGHHTCAKCLIEAKADVHLRDRDDWSAMMYAARSGNADITQLILNELFIEVDGNAGWEAGNQGTETKGAQTLKKDVDLLERRGEDSIMDFLVREIMASHGEKIELMSKSFPSIISCPGRSGEVLLSKLFVEQKCPFKFKEAYLPHIAPLTLMSRTKSNASSDDAGDQSASLEADTGTTHKLPNPLMAIVRLTNLAKPKPHLRTTLNRTMQERLEEKMVAQLLDDSKFEMKFKNALGRNKSEVFLFSCQVPGMVTPNIVQALAEAPSNSALQTQLAHAIIEFAWDNGFRNAYILDWLLQILALVMQVLCSAELQPEVETPMVPLIVILVVYIKIFFDEVSQVVDYARRKSILRYGLSFSNWVDWSRIFCYGFGWYSTWKWQGTMADRAGVGAVSAMLWFRVLYGLRAFEYYGIRMLPILDAVKDTRAFVVVMAFGTAAATNAYYIIRIGDSDEPPAVRLHEYFLKMFRLIWVGDFDLYELDGGDTFLTNNTDGFLEHSDPDPSSNWLLIQLLFFIVCLFLTIAMLNLLVGILGANYERYEALSLPRFLRERAQIISSISCRFYGSCLWNEEWKAEFLWAAMKKEQDPEDERSVRAAMKSVVKKHFDHLEEHATTQKDAMEAQQKALEDQKQALEKHAEMQKNAMEAQQKALEDQKQELEKQKQTLDYQTQVLEEQKKTLQFLQSMAATSMENQRQTIQTLEIIRSEMCQKTEKATEAFGSPTHAPSTVAAPANLASAPTSVPSQTIIRVQTDFMDPQAIYQQCRAILDPQQSEETILEQLRQLSEWRNGSPLADGATEVLQHRWQKLLDSNFIDGYEACDAAISAVLQHFDQFPHRVLD